MSFKIPILDSMPSEERGKLQGFLESAEGVLIITFQPRTNERADSQLLVWKAQSDRIASTIFDLIQGNPEVGVYLQTVSMLNYLQKTGDAARREEIIPKEMTPI